MKKPIMVVVMLTMVAVAVVPALAQDGEFDVVPAPAQEVAQEEERCPDMPDVPCRFDPESGTYQVLYLVMCDIDAACPVDENGLVNLPDGTKAPYTDYSDWIGGPGGAYEYVDGEFVLVETYPPVEPEYISPEFCAEYRADGRCDTFWASYE